MNGEKAGSLAETLFIQGCPRPFTCIEHGVQGILQLYVICDLQAAEFSLMKVNFKNARAPHLGFAFDPPVQEARTITTRPASCL